MHPYEEKLTELKFFQINWINIAKTLKEIKSLIPLKPVASVYLLYSPLTW